MPQNLNAGAEKQSQSGIARKKGHSVLTATGRGKSTKSKTNFDWDRLGDQNYIMHSLGDLGKWTILFTVVCGIGNTVL